MSKRHGNKKNEKQPKKPNISTAEAILRLRGAMTLVACALCEYKGTCANRAVCTGYKALKREESKPDHQKDWPEGCPQCGWLNYLHMKGNEFHCPSCGLDWMLDESKKVVVQ